MLLLQNNLQKFRTDTNIIICNLFQQRHTEFFRSVFSMLQAKKAYYKCVIYNIPINDTPFEIQVFWPSDTESHIKLTFSEFV